MAWWGWVLLGWAVAAVLVGFLLGAAAAVISRREAAERAAHGRRVDAARAPRAGDRAVPTPRTGSAAWAALGAASRSSGPQ